MAVRAGTTTTNPAIASTCLAIHAVINGGVGVLDISNPTISMAGGLLDGLTASGILPANAAASNSPQTPSSNADLIAFGSVPTPEGTCKIPSS